VLSGCGHGGTTSQCDYQKGLVKEAIGSSLFSDLRIDKSGKVTIMGSLAAFGKGNVAAQGVAALVLSRDTYSLVTGPTWSAWRGGGGAFRPFVLEAFDSSYHEIHINPAFFPMSAGGVQISDSEAFVHELGHAVGHANPAFRAAFFGSSTMPAEEWKAERLSER